MKQILLVIFLLIGTISYSQKNLETPYEHKMDSIATYNLMFKYHESEDRTFEKNYILNKVRLTFATRVNTDELSNLGLDLDGDYDEVEEDGFNDATTDDYLSIFKYDLRAKFYITRDIRFLTRVVIMGTKYRDNQYSAGFFIKF